MFCFNGHLRHLKEPAQDTLGGFLQAYTSGLETGDLEHVALSLLGYSYTAYLSGQELPALKQTMDAHREVIQRFRQDSYFHIQSSYYQAVLNLLEWQAEPDRLFSEDYNEEERIKSCLSINKVIELYQIYFNKLILSYLFQRYENALKNARLASQYEHVVKGLLFVAIFSFYDALTQLAVYSETSQTEQSNILKRVAVHQEHLHEWATHAPSNHTHRCLLVAAERSRVLDEKALAIDLYDRAIASAKVNSYIQEEAIANELAAKFYLGWGKDKVAAGYMQEAYYCYARWGAKAKTESLESCYPELLRSILQEPNASLGALGALATIAAPASSIYSGTYKSSSKSSNSNSINTAIDFTALLKASQALSGTIHLGDLLHQLTQIIFQNSSADRCALILPNLVDEWRVEAIATYETTQLCDEPLDGNTNVPVKLIQYVKNTHEVVVINDGKTELPVIGQYLNQQQPKSVLCLPILNQAQLMGILYLENQATSKVFTSDRLQLLNLLCTQAAISLKNVHLYQQSQIKSQELEKSLECLKQTQQQVQEAQEFLQLVIDSIPQLIFWKDIQSTYLGCNRLFAQAAGLNDCKDIIGKTDYDLPWKKEESDWYQEYDRKIMASNIPELGIIETQQQANGKQTWAETNKIPLQDIYGKTIGILGTYSDITNRKQLEQEKSRLIAILESTSDMVGIVDNQGKSLYLNQAGQRLLQISTEKINQFHIFEVLAPRLWGFFQTEALPYSNSRGNLVRRISSL